MSTYVYQYETFVPPFHTMLQTVVDIKIIKKPTHIHHKTVLIKNLDYSLFTNFICCNR